MAAVLTGPFAAAAIILGAAGLAKLRSRSRPLLGLAELSLACWCLLSPGRLAAVALCCAYATFAITTLALSRRRAPCGCFGADEEPASAAQSTISTALAAVALAAAITPPHAALSLLGRSPLQATVLLIGVAGSAYAAVLAYTQLPHVWRSWSR